MQRIGILGGTFNPIHAGHLYLSAEFHEKLNLTKILLIPDYTPPHKELVDLADSIDRYKMCQIAASGSPFLEVSDYEIRRCTKSYTVHTVEHYKQEYPDAELFLLMGSDMYYTVDTWFEYQQIFNCVTICAGARNAGEFEAMVKFSKVLEEKGAKVEIINITPVEVSSTAIRSRIMQGEQFPERLPPAVAEYINVTGLYIGENEEIQSYKKLLSQILKPKRYEHSICVAKEAAALAIIYNADAKKAYTAGLLHDIVKDIPYDKQLQMLEEFGIILSGTETKVKKLWHAIIGAEYVHQVLGINEPEIINAIRYHTTAREGISLLETIIYLADCVSFDREYDDVEIIREKIKENLNCAMRYALSLSIKGLVKRELPIHIDTIKAYNDFVPEQTNQEASFE